MNQVKRFQSAIILTAVLLIIAIFFAMIYYFDNKYTLRAPVAQDGTVFLSEQDLLGPVYLADGWELWPGVLLAPDALADTPAPVKTYIGRYLNLSDFTPDRSPYGGSTWRLRLRYDGAPTNVTLLLPEIFCAWKLYVGGEEIAAEGSLEPYRPMVRDTTVNLPLTAETEIVLQTANYSHYYSGVTYPPLVDSAQAIQHYTGVRLLAYAFLSFGALVAAFFSAAFWLGGLRGKRRDPVALLFGGLSIGFAVWVSYPFSRFLGVPLVQPLYALEDAAFLLVLWCALRIALHLCGLCTAKWAGRLSRFAFAMLAVGVVVPLLVLPAMPAFALIYGKLITTYRLLAALALIGLAVYGTLRGRPSCGWMLGGTGIFAMGLFASALTVSTFEPAQFFWFEEYGAIALVCCFGILAVRRHYALVQENERLTEHLSDEVERKTHEMGLLVRERDDLISKFLHDMRSPAAFMLSYAQMVREHNVSLDEHTKEQLAVIEEKCGLLSDRVHQVQQYTAQNPLITPRKPVELCAFLREFYRFNRPDVEMDGQNFLLDLPDSVCWVQADPEKLERLLQNLIYNAVSYTPGDGEIRLTLTRDDENAYLTVRDTGAGIPPEILPKLFDRFFTTRANEGGSGLGLYIVRTIAREHGGEVTVESKEGAGAVLTVRLPLHSK